MERRPNPVEMDKLLNKAEENNRQVEATGRRSSKSAADFTKEKAQLKKTVTLLNGITIIIGSIIGSGIFISPTGIQKEVGSVGLSLIVWIVGGIFSSFGAYCFAELGTLIHHSGADYAYIMVAFGDFIAFMRLWIEVIVIRPTSSAIIGLTFATYIAYPLFGECASPALALRLLAAFALSIFAIFGTDFTFSSNFLSYLTIQGRQQVKGIPLHWDALERIESLINIKTRKPLFSNAMLQNPCTIE